MVAVLSPARMTAVSVQILKLHLLGQLPAEGRGVLAPLREHLVDLIVQLQIIVGRLGRRVEFLHRLGKTAGQKHQQPRRQKQPAFFHRRNPSMG